MQRAEQLVTNEGFNALPVEPKIIAKNRNIVVKAKPETSEGVSGMLIRNGNQFAIFYATHLQNEGFERFSISHELGHFFLDGHIDHVFSNGDIHESHSGFASSDKHELEADCFAAGLLMPNPFFSKEINKYPDGLKAIEELSNLCRTSITATAIRYTECTSCPVAIVLSSGKSIDFCFMSKSFREIKGLQFIRNGALLPKASLTAKFNVDLQNISACSREENETNLSDWFGCLKSIRAKEEIIGLGKYGKTLTVITCLESISNDQGYAEDDWDYGDEEYEEMYTPRFKK